MFERDLNNSGNNDEVVAIPAPAESQAERTDRYRSRVTRDGTRSLEIEIPRHRVTCGFRCCLLLLFLMIPLCFVLGGGAVTAIMTVTNGSSGLFFLIPAALATIIVFIEVLVVKSSAFTQIKVTITWGDYCLSRRGITWRSFFQIMFVPSHFTDLESGQFIESDPKESHYVRHAGLRAQIVIHRNDSHSVSKDIKIGSMSFARGLSDEELEWLTEEINRFLRQT